MPVDVSETGGPIDANTLGIGKYMSAYLPGPRHGASQPAKNNSPLLGPDENVLTHRRNFYSTKLIPLQTVKDGFFFVFGDAGRDIVILEKVFVTTAIYRPAHLTVLSTQSVTIWVVKLTLFYSK